MIVKSSFEAVDLGPQSFTTAAQPTFTDAAKNNSRQLRSCDTSGREDINWTSRDPRWYKNILIRFKNILIFRNYGVRG